MSIPFFSSHCEILGIILKSGRSTGDSGNMVKGENGEGKREISKNEEE